MRLEGELAESAARIKLLAMDCDGVLTDGRLFYGEQGESLKAFHVHDGQGIVSWHQAGLISAVITARSSTMLSVRGEELGIRYVSQGVDDKAAELKRICQTEGIDLSEAAYIGDDLADLAAFAASGLPISVADAVPEVIAAAAFVTTKSGGHGAVREAIDTLLNCRQ